MNKVILIGRLTKDPELRYTQSGAAVCSFTLAVDRGFTNQQGEREADFISVVVWNKSAESAAEYLSKGRQAAVEGRLQIRSYEANDGTKRWVAEVVASHVMFLGGKNGEQDKREAAAPSTANKYGEEVIFSDADLPF